MAVRYVTAHVIVGEPTFEWCDVCQFNALGVFPCTLISEAGVSPFGVVRRCLRCNPPDGEA